MNRLLLATGLMLAAGAAHADFVQDFKACAALRADAERLACYDKLAAEPAAIVAPVAAAAPVAAVPALTPEQSFGIETLNKAVREEVQQAPDTDVIASRLVGPLQSWNAKTRFVLANGQVWKNVGGDEVYIPGGAENKIVTVERGAFGAYYLAIEGLNRKAKVKRVK